jgi:hypothetical protein
VRATVPPCAAAARGASGDASSLVLGGWSRVFFRAGPQQIITAGSRHYASKASRAAQRAARQARRGRRVEAGVGGWFGFLQQAGLAAGVARHYEKAFARSAVAFPCADVMSYSVLRNRFGVSKRHARAVVRLGQAELRQATKQQRCSDYGKARSADGGRSGGDASARRRGGGKGFGEWAWRATAYRARAGAQRSSVYEEFARAHADIGRAEAQRATERRARRQALHEAKQHDRRGANDGGGKRGSRGSGKKPRGGKMWSSGWEDSTWWEDVTDDEPGGGPRGSDSQQRQRPRASQGQRMAGAGPGGWG